MKNVFYDVDGIKYLKTFEAWHHINAGARSWHLHLFDDTFSKVNWTYEPQKSFDQLVSERIRSIKSRYKKINLWYSAGRDSNFILRSFLRNNVPIDQLTYVHWVNIEDVRNEIYNVERTIKTEYERFNKPVPKIKIFQPGPSEYLRYWKFISSGNLSAGVGSNYGYNINGFGTVIEAFPEFQEADTCHLFGYEKPHLYYEDGNVYFRMVDSTINQSFSSLENIEWFFLNEQVPELVVKQCHMLLRGIEIYAKQKSKHISTAIQEMQESKSLYDLRCLLLGLEEAASVQTGFGLFKAYGFSNEIFYKNLYNITDSEVWGAKKYYKKFLHNVTDLMVGYKHENQKDKLPGILTKRYLVKNYST